MMTTLFITGTDTDVGKTWVTTALVSYLLNYRKNDQLGIIKLMQTGIGDQEHYQQFFTDNPQIETITPLRFAAPLAPPLAAAKEEKTIDLNIIWRELNYFHNKYPLVIVEALGGLGSPVTDELTVADLGGSWRLDTILVVPVKLGAIAHAVANVSYARSCKIKLKGIILSCIKPVSEQELADWTPIDLIQSLTQVPVLGILPHLETIDIDKMAHLASDWQIERILG